MLPTNLSKLRTPRGTRVIAGREAALQADWIAWARSTLRAKGFEEIILPSLDFAEHYDSDAGPELANQMYTFSDKGGRELCLRPEATATCKRIAATYPGAHRIFYIQRCYRYERPQAGRYREFTQLGVEWLNCEPGNAESLAMGLAQWDKPVKLSMSSGVKRGLGLYNGDGFEILAPALGAQKQVAGGGPYAGGAGFAIGVDRLMMLYMADD